MISSAVFLFGLVIGSFLNSVIYRMGKGKSALRGRSYCPRCKHPLSWNDLIPFLSFLLLQGKCRYCKKSISLQYPLVELLTAILFVLIFSHLNFGIVSDFGFRISDFFTLAYLWAMAALLVAIFVYDLKHFLIPDKFIYSAISLAALWRILEFGISAPLVQSLVAGISAALFFLAIFLISRGAAMGFGDVKLAFLLGLFLGWPSILVAMFLAFSLGAVSGIVLIAFKKKGLKSEVPFAPFLIAGTAVAFFFGESILHWYLGLFLV